MTEEKVDFYTLNVGHGDSHVIHFEQKQASVIIDPGNGNLVNRLLFERLDVQQVPLILISHGDMDHMSGLNEIISQCIDNHIKPGCIYFNHEAMLKIRGKPKIEKFLLRFKELVDIHKLTCKYIMANDNSADTLTHTLEQLGLQCNIIYPQYLDFIDVHKDNDFNLASVLLLLSFDNKKILYTGDLPSKGWDQAALRGDLTSDVFKVPHHGGKISDTPGQDMQKILENVNPNFALVSVGDKYKHPLPEVISAIVTHDTKPNLFCTRMTGQCCADKRIKGKILDFYKTAIEDRDREILQLGNHNGTLCAGTIRVTFSRESTAPFTSPSVFSHLQMLKNLFNPTALLCHARF